VGIIDASRKKSYKIATWALLAFGVLFFSIGGLIFFAGMMNKPTLPNEIHLTTAGINYNTGTGRYELNVHRRETAIMVNTAPLGSGRRVTFEVLDKDECLHITDRPMSENGARDLTHKNRNGRHTNSIWPGERFFLTLVGGSEQSFQFGETVEILIQSEATSVFLYVNIVLPPDQVKFDFQIVEESRLWLFEEISATQYHDEVYKREPPLLPAARYSYKFVPKLMVWGSEVTDIKPEDMTVIPVEFDSGIRLLGAAPNTDGVDYRGFENIYIPIEIIVAVMSSDEPMEFVFMVTADHFGKHIDFFTLRIVK